MSRAFAAAVAALSLLAAAPAQAEFSSVSITPRDGIISPDGVGEDASLQVEFSATTTGTVTLSGAEIDDLVQTYAQSGVSSTINLPATDISVANRQVDLTLSLDGDGGDDTTAITIGVDTLAPAPPASFQGFPANEAIILQWSGFNSDPFAFADNAARFVIYWSIEPITDVIKWQTSLHDLDNGLAFPAAEQPDGVTVTEVGLSDNHVIDGLVNGKDYYFLIEAYDPVEYRSGVAADFTDRGDGTYDVTPEDAIQARPLKTVNLAEFLDLKDQCFVVTAAYGDARSPWVQTYRDFRDRVLLALPGGQTLVRAYYHYGPDWARSLRAHPTARRVARAVLSTAAPIVALSAALGPATTAAALLLLLLLPLRPWRWRRSAALAVALAAVAAAAPAHALDDLEALTLSVSPFLPEDAGGSNASGMALDYADLYGDTGTYRIELEYVWLPLIWGGQWGVGGRAGFAADDGTSLARDTAGSFVASKEKSTFLFVPVSLLARYRGAWHPRQPLVPSIHTGVDAWGFQEKRESADEGLQNYVLGWHAGGELELVLDSIDRSNASMMKRNYGIEDTALFFGYQWTQLDDFGDPRTLDLSHWGWTAGLRFVF